ncbi:hypothetical protein OHA04_45695 (plasmid) [Streptomyces sp. NBC_01590]|uniref:hypothetical protein n=1 Tax=Streptomyces sp. NBC_01590 TaxID=2975887 RepID=UPI003869CEBA
MTSLPTAPRALDEYFDHTPVAHHAALHDPQFAAELHRLRNILGHLDTTLHAEGLNEEQRHRIAAGVVAKCLDPAEAARRVQEHAARVQELAWHGDVPATLRAAQ